MNEIKKSKLFAGANALIVAAAAIAIVLLLNYLSVRHYRRFDWTKEGAHTLSAKTEQVLKALKEPVTVYAVLAGRDPLNPEVRERAVSLLDAYKGLNDKLTVKILDPERDAVTLEKLGSVNFNTVIFEGKAGRQVVNLSTLTESDDSVAMFGGPQTLKSFKGEEAFTNAIASLSESKLTVCFSEGHGERPFASQDSTGLSVLKTAIEGENYSVKPQGVAGAEPLPADCAVLVVAGPQIPFQPAEAAKVGAYLQNGGRLLLLADPNVDRSGGGFSDNGLEGLLSERGLTLHKDLAVDPAQQAQVNAQEPMFYATPSQGHAITRPFIGGGQAAPALLPIARSLGLPENASAPAAKKWTPLLASSASGFGITNLKAIQGGAISRSKEDIAGPLILAAAYGDDKEESGERIVVFGSSRFASDLFQPTRNPDYLVNSIHWLARRAVRIAIPAQRIESANLSITRRQVGFATLWLVLLAPGLVAGAGIFMLIRRRRG